MSAKRKCLSLKEKIDIITESEKTGLSARKLAEKLGIGKTQVTNIISNKCELKKLYEEGGSEKQKRKFPKTEGLAVDQVVFNWFCKARNKNFPISGPLIKQKALEAAQSLQLVNFKASNGWLEKFCQRHSITFKTICGESADVNIDDIEEWKRKLLFILKDYSPRDIYNADETGLCYRAMPTKTFALKIKEDKCAGRKSAKQRLTVLLCANMEGEKEDPLVIGRSRKPRCFKGENISKLPLEWVSNKKAWMTREIMTTWLHKFNNKMKRQNRKVLLFLDNATSHSNLLLENVKIVFLPPNTTAHCQPLDQGIIQNFKLIYRSLIVKRLLSCVDSDCSFQETEKQITIANTLIWISVAWKKLSPDTIKKCFSKAGFSQSEAEAEVSIEEEEDNVPLAQLFPKINDASINLKEFASMDDEVLTESPEDLTIANCLEEVRENGADSDSESESEERENIKSSISSMSEACEKLRDLENYFLCSNNSEVAMQISQLLMKCESEVFRTKMKNSKQTSIEDYFK